MRLSVAGVLLCTLAAVPNLRAQRVSSEFDPNPAHPFGRPNPAAPPELQQFAFMVGAFDCTDRVRQADGTWIEFPAIWNAHYVLNGWGIQDVYWNPQFATSNIRIFDPAAGRWKVTFFKMPGYGSGVWEGAQEGDRMVMRQPTRGRNGQPAESRLTFYDISASAFRWKSESVQGDSVRAGWTSACSRRR